ncbi:hypothetical protein [Brevundimonas variabilis]|uniref:Uncharacterized protein n=1 Tax=Brevundimonas variabilis TaxID=74312 RepID=A0A7W9FG23_9CAUL|nr:hypothetical protein [Brevundimonas variabilis]MBB5746143.1 hypothetical protein [Brevundimonas variabilis]
MDREIKIALGIAIGCAGLLIGFVFLIRYAVPAVLGAPFSGSLIAATVVGLAGIMALVWAGWKLAIWASRSLKR